MQKELKALSLLLTYPEKEILSAIPEIQTAFDQSEKIPSEDKKKIKKFLSYLSNTDLPTIQKTYVETFDIGRAASLNLFEHFLGDSRDRGASMTSLKSLYKEHGLKLQTNEMPDYLPVVLEFLSGLEWVDAVTWLESAAPHITKIDTALQKVRSPWNPVTSTLLHIAGAQPVMAQSSNEDLLPTVEADSFDSPVIFGESKNPVKQGIHFLKKQQ